LKARVRSLWPSIELALTFISPTAKNLKITECCGTALGHFPWGLIYFALLTLFKQVRAQLPSAQRVQQHLEESCCCVEYSVES